MCKAEYEVIKSGNLPGLKKLLETNPRILRDSYDDGVPAFFYAASNGDLVMMRYITEYCMINHDVLDVQGNSALHYGVRSGNLEMVRYLTERVGLSCIKGNHDLITPFDLAEQLGFEDIAAYFEGVCGCKLEDMYRNPILRGMHPDPSIVRVDRDYYLVNSSFHYFPCIPIYHSRDLVSWELIGHAITDEEWAGLNDANGGCGYWAPDISFYRGRFYITATLRGNGDSGKVRIQMVTSSKNPQGPYDKPYFLDEDGIDPSIFTDINGRRYMVLNKGARIFEIEPDGSRIISEPTLLWYGDMKRTSEGPHILYKDGYYYLFMAEGGTGIGHRITVGRSTELYGVYEPCPYNPIMRQWNPDEPIQCCGHGKPVQTAEGDWYMVYLCCRKGTAGYGFMGRETCLDPITWTGDGWPLVNRLRGPSILQYKPKLSTAGVVPACPNPDIALPTLDNLGDWKSVRGIKNDSFGKDAQGFWLKGHGFDVNSLSFRSMLVQNQTSFSFKFGCTISVQDVQEAADAGLLCYYDENSYIKYGVVKCKGDLYLLVAEFVDDCYISKRLLPLPEVKQVYLQVKADYLRREFMYRIGNGELLLAEVLRDTKYISSEGLSNGKRFTGATAGIYCHGVSRVHFDTFIMMELDGVSKEFN